MLISSNTYLEVEEMKDNAQYIYDKLFALGWTPNAICGVLGNMQSESTMNPGLWESLDEFNMERGFGLVQWTPATNFTEWATANGLDWYSIDSQIARIKYEYDTHIEFYPTTLYPMTFEEFIHSTDSPNNLALIFLKNYERPLNQDQPIRGTNANYWWNTLTLNPVITTPKKKMPLYMYMKHF